MSERPALRALAERVGLLPSYVDQTGQTRFASDATRERLLAALGFDVPSEAAAEAALAALDAAAAEEVVAPVRVLRASRLSGATTRVRPPAQARGALRVRSSLLLEREVVGAVERRTDEHGTLHVPLAATAPLGYHTLRVEVGWTGGERVVEQRLIVVPDACWMPEDDSARRCGLTANLYTVRSARNWGVGDAGDLRRLLEWCGEVGLDFVGVNPLHALFNRGSEVSPYSPVSRLYRNPLYLDIEAVPELVRSDEARRLLADESRRAELEAVRAGDRIPYERIVQLKRPVLRALHRTFRERADPARCRAYEAYRAAEGRALDDFATFLALDETVTRLEGGPRWWREWPEEWRDPTGRGVARFRDEHALEVDFHRWVQFELDRQLADAADAARAAGVAVGLYQDLAIGSSGGGSDAWSHQSLFVHGVSIGAPPDPLGPEGQDWGLPPLDPRQLRADGYAYWSRLLRAAFRHAGALRVDHVLGLFRQFWIPWGMSGAEGAYVKFPTEELLGVLALESHRHRAIVVGEDLGTVPPEVEPTLRAWSILSSKVMMFERGEHGAFRPSASYPAEALATANTHDLPTMVGWWRARDLDLREQLGRLSPEDAARERQHRAQERRQLLRRLHAEGLLPSAVSPPPSARLRGAVHRFLRCTPCRLVGLSLDDLAGEVEPVNVPGATADEYPSWTRRLRRTLEDLTTAEDVRIALGDERP